MLSEAPLISIAHISRNANKVADSLTKKDSQLIFYSAFNVHPELYALLYADSIAPS